MALVITDECINCGACVSECPNNAIYEGAQEWTIADGTSVTEPYRMKSGKEIDPFEQQAALHDDLFFIVPDKCTECTGFHDEPQCASVCPVDCCVLDPEREESEDELLERKERLHN